MRFMAMYQTPLGYKFSDFEAEDIDDAMGTARSRLVFGVVELAWLKSLGRDDGGDEGSQERGSEPPESPEDGLDPGVVPAGENHERARDGDRAGFPRFIKEGHVLLVGQPDKVKVTHLTKHACLVRGDFDVQRLRTAEEVSAFAGVPPDLE